MIELPELFTINTDATYSQKCEIRLTNSIFAKEIMICPKDWNSHISFRVGLKLIVDRPEIVYNPDETKRSYSSIWKNNTYYEKSMLNSSNSWS